MKLTMDEKVELLFYVLEVKKFDSMQIATAKTFIQFWEKHNSYKTLVTYLGTFKDNLKDFYHLSLL